MRSQVFKRSRAPTNRRIGMKIYCSDSLTTRCPITEEHVPIDCFDVSFVRSWAGYTSFALVGRSVVRKIKSKSFHDPVTPIFLSILRWDPCGGKGEQADSPFPSVSVALQSSVPVRTATLIFRGTRISRSSAVCDSANSMNDVTAWSQA